MLEWFISNSKNLIGCFWALFIIALALKVPYEQYKLKIILAGTGIIFGVISYCLIFKKWHFLKCFILIVLGSVMIMSGILLIRSVLRHNICKEGTLMRYDKVSIRNYLYTLNFRITDNKETYYALVSSLNGFILGNKYPIYISNQGNTAYVYKWKNLFKGLVYVVIGVCLIFIFVIDNM